MVVALCLFGHHIDYEQNLAKEIGLACNNLVSK